MDSDVYTRLAEVISLPRLERYRRYAGSDEDAVRRYFWNIRTSSALLPPLAVYEIALRNSAHTALSAKLGTVDWFSFALQGKDLSDFRERRQKIVRQQGREVTIDKIVSELMLGFWTYLLARKHHGLWWSPTNLPDSPIFRMLPGKPDIDRSTRGELHRRAMYFLVLRNRVSHHESILEDIEPYGLPRLQTDTVHSMLLETIEWISPTLSTHVHQVDVFPLIWNRK